MLTVVLALIGCPLICCVYRRRVRRRRATRDAMKALNASTAANQRRRQSASDCTSMNGTADNVETVMSSASSLEEALSAATGARDASGTKRGQSIGVKIKILISYVQLVRGTGASFDVRWPPMFAISLQFLSVIELDLFALVPFGCLFEVSYHTSLITQTAMPLVLCGTLAAATAMLRLGASARSAGLQSNAPSCEGARLRAIVPRSLMQTCWPTPTSLLALSLSETLSDLIFLVLFLVYPSCIAKSYSAFQCIPLPEVDRRYLRADLAIDCDSILHQTIMWYYALPAAAVYTFGVPALFAFVLFRHGEELQGVGRS